MKIPYTLEDVLNPRAPAPWRFVPGNGGILDGDGHPVAYLSTRFAGNPKQSAELGNKICAVDDLIASLEGLLDFHNEGRIPAADALTRAELALDKAKGKNDVGS